MLMNEFHGNLVNNKNLFRQIKTFLTRWELQRAQILFSSVENTNTTPHTRHPAAHSQIIENP